MRIQKLREGGAYAIEVHSFARFIDKIDQSLKTTQLAVVYADKGLPSHCVRIFVYDWDQ